MKIAIVYFTYSGDFEIINKSYKAIERLMKNYPNITIDTYICDDLNNPLPEIPKFGTYMQTDWERNNNLNGFENIKGIMSVYNILAQQDYTWIIKCDCDTFINNLDWLFFHDSSRTILIGRRTNMSYCGGNLYAISAKLSFSFLDLLNDKNICERIKKGKGREDKLIYTLAISTCYNISINPKLHEFDNKFTCLFLHKNTLYNITDAVQYPFVDFRPSIFDRDTAVQRMQEYIDKLKELNLY